ncbi:hypothetical protein [Paenibacillus sp. YPG26]|uniref:hypothetical protein n=1 Tax=Paenibacillus sp. YPG26 TaxID=2878915 RepID=UPI00203E0D46|nr:hypothetical protein [Paenibacillus sp. YPG26]USB34066.1 hypothetical protein LDO05_04380 [Paenibacillus sp. YPG26]
MNRRHDTPKQKLDQELESLHFTYHKHVLKRTHPGSWSEQLRRVWNYEIEISLIPAGGALAVIALILFLRPWSSSVPPYNHEQSADRGPMIEAYGNTYWKKDYEKAVARLEDKTQD